MRAIIAFLQEHAWIVAGYAALVATWNAWNTWRREISRFSVRITRPRSYKPDEGVEVTAIYRGGPAVKFAKARARVVGIKRIRWFEAAPAGPPEAAILKPEQREVSARLDSNYLDRFWYIDVIADGGASRRKWLRVFPKFWLPPIELGVMTLDRVGAVAIPGRLERALGAVAKEARKNNKKR